MSDVQTPVLLCVRKDSWGKECDRPESDGEAHDTLHSQGYPHRFKSPVPPEPITSVLEATVGQRYAVTATDCCMTVSFTARLVSVTVGNPEDPSNWGSPLVFDNGVTLECGNTLVLEPVE